MQIFNELLFYAFFFEKEVSKPDIIFLVLYLNHTFSQNCATFDKKFGLKFVIIGRNQKQDFRII